MMTSQVVQGTSLKKGGYGQFRGQCVNARKWATCDNAFKFMLMFNVLIYMYQYT